MKYYKNKKIIFRFDIGGLDGFGHFKRSIPLINFFIKNGFLIVICTNFQSKKFLNLNLKNRVFLKKEHESEESYLRKINKKYEGFIIIIDKLYNYKKNSIVQLKNKNEVVFIQNYSSGAKIANKLIFPDDHNLSFKKNKKIYTGSKYLVLRDEINKIKNIKRKNYLGITFGGSDPYNLTIKVLNILKKIKWKNKTIFFYGDGYKKKNTLIKKVREISNFKASKFNFKKLISSKLIISSFGVTSYEVAHFKIFNLVILLNKKIDISKIDFMSSTIKLDHYKDLNLYKIKDCLYKYWHLNKKKNKFKIKNNAKIKILKIIKN
jgi:spore coat polysaccharide biosynthesis predicted glycosyltransferase SpsG